MSWLAKKDEKEDGNSVAHCTIRLEARAMRRKGKVRVHVIFKLMETVHIYYRCILDVYTIINLE